MTEDTKARILEKAKDMFMRYGIRSVTMDEVASQCGVSKKTIYQLFDDKDALVESIMSSHLGEIESKCIIEQLQSENAVHEIFLANEMGLQMLEQMNPATMYDLRKYYPTAYKILEQHKRKFMYQSVAENIERGIKEGLYRPDINIGILASMRLETTMMGFDQEIFPKSKYAMAEVMQELSDHFLYGITNAKGQKMIEKYKQQEKTQQV
jgi:AcrR family transcriptional regulator